MNKYEILYILSSRLEDAAKEAAIEKYSSIITSAGGSVEKLDKWGTKKFAYPINFQNDGYYVLMNFTSDDTVPAEITRQMRLSDDVVRNMLLKKA